MFFNKVFIVFFIFLFINIVYCNEFYSYDSAGKNTYGGSTPCGCLSTSFSTVSGSFLSDAVNMHFYDNPSCSGSSFLFVPAGEPNQIKFGPSDSGFNPWPRLSSILSEC